MSTALSGVGVLEVSQFDAGAACGELLAWFGADVVKIEEPAGAKSTRCAAADQPGVDSYEFIVLNANKRSVTCDLATQAGKESLHQLLANADVLIVSTAPDFLERQGLRYDAVKALNPRIIYARITGFASTTAHASYLCNDGIAQAVGSSLSTTGYQEGPPSRTGCTTADTGAALHCAMGILAALHQRRATGRGQSIEVDMQGAVISLSRTGFVDHLNHGNPLERMGNANHGGAVPSDLFPCKPGGPDDYVMVHVNKTAVHHWQALLKVMGREDLLDDPRYADWKARRQNAAEVNGLVTSWCRQRTKIEAMEAIQGGGTPAGAVLDMKDISENPHLRKRGMVSSIEHPVRGQVSVLASPIKLSASQVAVTSAPLLGAHTREVLADWLKPDRAALPSSQGAAGNPDATQALAGIRVVDLTQFEAGPSCTEALAWFGAEVVKIEEPGRGERGRYGNTDKAGVDSFYFLIFNANKRSLTCDLKSEQGKELLRKLIRNADILVENMAPGAIERLGFGYDVVRELNPRLVYAQVKGFAADGPYAKYLCFDNIALTCGGSLSITGVDSGLPLRPGPHLGDTGAGMHCVTGILAALCQRDATGHGQRVEVAMQESVINFTRKAFASYLAAGNPPGRDGDRNLYPCKGNGTDDYCYVPISGCDDGQWRSLLQAIGKQELVDDPRFSDAAQRAANSRDVDALIAQWCSGQTKLAAMQTLQKAGVPAGAVLNTQDLFDDQELRRSEMFVTITHPVRGQVTIPGWPVRMSDSPAPTRCAPLLGENTAQVLAEWLKLSENEVQEQIAACCSRTTAGK